MSLSVLLAAPLALAVVVAIAYLSLGRGGRG